MLRRLISLSPTIGASYGVYAVISDDMSNNLSDDKMTTAELCTYSLFMAFSGAIGGALWPVSIPMYFAIKHNYNKNSKY